MVIFITGYEKEKHSKSLDDDDFDRIIKICNEAYVCWSPASNVGTICPGDIPTTLDPKGSIIVIAYNDERAIQYIEQLKSLNYEMLG